LCEGVSEEAYEPHPWNEQVEGYPKEIKSFNSVQELVLSTQACEILWNPDSNKYSGLFDKDQVLDSALLYKKETANGVIANFEKEIVDGLNDSCKIDGYKDKTTK
jgi:hypothetical protein